MPDTNGSGRLDRIEALLRQMAERQYQLFGTAAQHEERINRIETTLEGVTTTIGMVANTLGSITNQLGNINGILIQHTHQVITVDERIEKLVSAIGVLVPKMDEAR